MNIITKQPTDEWHGAWNSYMSFPEHKSEAATKRTDFNLMGGLTDTLSMRLYGNYSKTQADAWDINSGHQLSPKAAIPAGREGVRNKDINGLLRWEFMPQQTLEFEAGASRQGISMLATQRTKTAKQIPSRCKVRKLTVCTIRNMR